MKGRQAGGDWTWAPIDDDVTGLDGGWAQASHMESNGPGRMHHRLDVNLPPDNNTLYM